MSKPLENGKLIVSVYDYSGAWVQPYIDAGYAVILWDYKIEGDILNRFGTFLFSIEEAIQAGYEPYGAFFAPPCTDVCAASAWTWPAKDAPGSSDRYEFESRTEEATFLIGICQVIVERFPWKFWVLENPPGRLQTLIPELAPFRKFMFQPWEFGDPITKRTVLWGNFNDQLTKTPVKPKTVRIKAKTHYYNSSAIWARTGGKSEKTKTLRSNTPPGFARAFFEANK